MPANCRPYEPRQMILLPELIPDWLTEGHLAHSCVPLAQDCPQAAR
jgi:hypothetical protein